MSTTFLAACAQRCADATPPNDLPPNDLPHELNQTIINYLSLADLAFVALRINRSFSAAARARIAVMWPQPRRLLCQPFDLKPRDLLVAAEVHLFGRTVRDAECSDD